MPELVTGRIPDRHLRLAGRCSLSHKNPGTGTYREVFPSDPTLNLACPVWSPDVSRLACDQFAVPDDPSRAGMYTIRSSDGGGLLRITTNPGGEDDPVDYSPDGTQIAFIRADPSRPPEANRAIFVVRLNGSGLHQISPWGSRGLGMNAGWSPDGSTIIFSSNGSLYRVSPDGSRLPRIPLHGLLTRSFAFDPDGHPTGRRSSLAWSRARPRQRARKASTPQVPLEATSSN